MRCNNRNTTARLRKVIDDAKSVPCMDCGKTFPIHIMQFDHRLPGSKTMDIRTGIRSLRRLRAEIALCDPVCSNCHSERTWLRRQPAAEASPVNS
jgi:hypothetical protein